MNILWVIIYSNGFINSSNAPKVIGLVIMSHSNTHFCTNVTDLYTKTPLNPGKCLVWVFVCLNVHNDLSRAQSLLNLSLLNFYLFVLVWHVNNSCLCYSPTAARRHHLAVIQCLWRCSYRGRKPEMPSHMLRDSTALCHGTWVSEMEHNGALKT